MVEHCTVHSFMTLLLSRCLGLLMVSMIFTTDHTHSLSLSLSFKVNCLLLVASIHFVCVTKLG